MSASARAAGALLERERELRILDEALDGVRAGPGRCVAIEGAAGIGKTELLSTALEAWRRRGLPVLAARAGLLERDYAFGVVRQLLEPHVTALEPAERERALAGAARLAGQLLREGETEAGPPRPDRPYATLHSLYWLVAQLAGDGPLVLAVDDLHWADEPSLRFLAYIARRVEDLPVLLVVALRPRGAGPADEPLADLLSTPRVEHLRLGELSVQAVTELVESALGKGCDEAFAAACHAASGGNPFLLSELLHDLARDGVAPAAGEAGRVADVRPDTIVRAVATRMARQDDDAAALAAAVAVLGDSVPLRLAAKLAGIDIDAAGRAADSLTEDDVFARRRASAFGRPLAFAHPLIQAAVDENLPEDVRGDLHARAARLLAGEGVEPGRIAAHLLYAPPTGDAFVVDALRGAARTALGQGAPAAAVAYLRRSLEEDGAVTDTSARLRELGLAEVRAGDPAALATLGRAVTVATEPADLGLGALEYGRALMFAGRAREAAEMRESVMADLRAAGATELVGMLEADQLISAHTVHSVRDRLLEHLEGFGPPSGQPSSAERVVLAVASSEEATAGDSASRAAEHALRALGDGQLLAQAGPEAPFYWQAVTTLTMCDRSDEAHRAASGALEAAKALGSVSGSAIALTCRAWFALHLGRLADAEVDARSALSVPIPYEIWELVRPMALGTLAEVLVERGAHEEAAELLDANPVRPQARDSLLYELVLAAAGSIEAARRDWRGALARFEEVGRRQEAWGATTPSIVSWRSRAALACLGLGEREPALSLSRDELERARRFGARRQLGIALRAHGLVLGGADGLAALEESVAVLDGSSARLEEARSLVELGAALRRRNRRSDARTALESGMRLARECGATALTGQAGEELAAAGARPRSAERQGLDALTASERRVAELAASGMSNPEIAQALFVTRKTVEVHLTRCYQKLSISSRAELPAALAGVRA